MRDKFSLPQNLPPNVFDDGQTRSIVDDYWLSKPQFVKQQIGREAFLETRITESTLGVQPIVEAI